jgi:tRNA dimethylallyltransferase
MERAADRPSVIINADSMQVYRELRVLTARPPDEDAALAPHRLYGHVAAVERYSVGRWLADIAAVLANAAAEGRAAVVVGGTGLYFKALTEGLATVPPIPAAFRADLAAEIAATETGALHARLAAVDPEDATAIRPTDRARIVRALEVVIATGRPLAEWKRRSDAPPLVGADAERIVLMPDRPLLHRRIAERAEQMVHTGAVEEVRALLGLGLDANWPAMKAIGVRELGDHLAGKISLDEAVASISTETRRYAKRQMTWLRNQMKDWPRLE